MESHRSDEMPCVIWPLNGEDGAAAGDQTIDRSDMNDCRLLPYLAHLFILVRL